MFGRRALREAVRAYAVPCVRLRTAPSVSELAARLGVSRNTLATDFHQLFGLTLAAISPATVSGAKRLLRCSNLSIGERVTRGLSTHAGLLPLVSTRHGHKSGRAPSRPA